MRILSVSCVYPNPHEPGLGPFVRSRLQSLSALANVKVVAPIALTRAVRYRFGKGKIPFRRSDGGTEVLHPVWAYPPGGTWINPVFLWLRLLPAAIRLRRRFRFDVIDAHFGFPDGVSACLLAAILRVPFTITLRGNETMHARAKLCGWVMKWALRRARRVIALSRRLGDFAIAAGVHPDQIKLIPNGIESGTFCPRDRLACRAKHRIGREARVILSAGSLIERKGHHLVVEAVGALRRAGVACELVLAGGPGREGEFERAVRQTIGALGLEHHVRLEGQVPPEHMAELMSAADVLCLASTREGWPNVVHEAMACGLPVVASDVGAVPQMIASDAFGFVVAAGAREQLTAALRRALEKDWDRQAISAWAASRSWEAVAREVFAEMRQICAEAQQREL